jgi:hypothetical protein
MTKTLEMGYSTPRQALGQGCPVCRFNGRILLVILFPSYMSTMTTLDSRDV